MPLASRRPTRSRPDRRGQDQPRGRLRHRRRALRRLKQITREEGERYLARLGDVRQGVDAAAALARSDPPGADARLALAVKALTLLRDGLAKRSKPSPTRSSPPPSPSPSCCSSATSRCSRCWRACASRIEELHRRGVADRRCDGRPAGRAPSMLSPGCRERVGGSIGLALGSPSPRWHLGSPELLLAPEGLELRLQFMGGFAACWVIVLWMAICTMR